MSVWDEISKRLPRIAGGRRNARSEIGSRGDLTEYARGRYFIPRHAQNERDWARAIRNNPLVRQSAQTYMNAVAQAEETFIPADHPRGEELAEITRELLVESPCFSWQELLRRISLYRYFGFTVLEWTIDRRADGIIEFSKINSRPFYTISSFETSESGEVLGAWQNYRTLLPRERLLYLADTSIVDRPEGLGLLASVNESVDRLERLESFEFDGYGKDMRNFPVGYVPSRGESGLGDEEYDQEIRRMEDLIQGTLRSEKGTTTLLSDTFQQTLGDGRVTNVPKWRISPVEGGSSSHSEIDRAIERIKSEIAIGLGTTFLLTGLKGVGTGTMESSKAEQFSLQVDEGLRTISEAIQKDLIVPLFDLNGWPQEAAPRLKMEEAQFTSSSEKVAAYLQIQQVNDDKVRQELAAEIGISLEDEEPEEEESEQPPNEGGRNADGDD